MFPAAARAVPELSSRWYLGVFLSRRTAKFDLALVAALAALLARRPWLLVLALPYARATFQTRHWRRRWVLEQNAAHVAGDFVGFLSLVEGQRPVAAGGAVTRVAYLVSRYPAVSHAFIQREVLRRAPRGRRGRDVLAAARR